MCTWRARASSPAGTSCAVSEAMAPTAVRIARSAPWDSATVMPVGAPSRTATAPVPTPSRASWPSRKSPAGSAPTAATSSTLSPSRAAATAVIAAEPPTTIQMPSTSFSCWPKDGVTSSPVTSTSGLQSPRTTRSYRDNVHPRGFEQGRVLGGDAGVGDQDVDLGRGADPGERALAHLGAVRHDHHLAGLAAHQPVDARLALVV